jgi:hypothetical protein
MRNHTRISQNRPKGLQSFWNSHLIGAPILGLMAINLLAQPVNAIVVPQPDGSLEFLFDDVAYDGASNKPPDPRSSNYWLKAVISAVDSDTVKISLQANLKDTPEAYIESVAFNLDPFATGTNLACAATPGICTGSPGNAPTKWNYRFDKDDVDLPNRASGFDFELLLPNANSANRLTGVEQFNITVDGLSVGAFNNENNGKPNSIKGLFGVAKIQGYGGSATLLDPPGDETSVPGPLPILGAVAAFKASRRLRNRLKPTAAAAPRSV